MDIKDSSLIHNEIIEMINLENEYQSLQELGFPFGEVRILSNLHLSKIWAETFWRRLERHSTREDPELPFIFENNPKTILEIGTAYGRVTRKIAEINSQKKIGAQIYGIELCSYLEAYFLQYKNRFPILNDVQIYFDDFFTSNKLKKGFFDVIVLPMGTFPSFPVEVHTSLFQRIKELLSPSGTFIFSSYKIKKEILPILAQHSGEILVSKGKGPIIGEFFDLPSIPTSYGARIISYLCFSILTTAHEKINTYVFRTIQELINLKALEQIIYENSFQIQDFDDSSHSWVYTISVIK